MTFGGGILALLISLSVSQGKDPAAEPAGAMPPVKVVRAFLAAYRTYKPTALKPLLADGVASPLDVDPFWFTLPPFKKAWGAQKLKPGKPNATDSGVSFQVEAERLDVGVLAAVDEQIRTAIKDLPPDEAAKKRKEVALKELKAFAWTYRKETVELVIVKAAGGWRVGSTGLAPIVAAPVAVATPAAVSAVAPSPAATEDEPEETGPSVAGYKRPSKKATAAYPAALAITKVEGVSLDSAFKARVVASVRNDGTVPIARVRANVFYGVTSGEVSDSGRSFVFTKEILCPKTTGTMETEALAPQDRIGFTGKLRLEVVGVEFDRPDAFGHVKSAVCNGTP